MHTPNDLVLVAMVTRRVHGCTAHVNVVRGVVLHISDRKRLWNHEIWPVLVGRERRTGLT
jgi:hypothetical protein